MRSLTLQRNVFLLILFFLLFLVVALVALLYQKSERVIVVPPVIEKEFWIEGANVSPAYLEQMGCFIGDLLLTRSPLSADLQLSVLMHHTAPSFASILSSKLVEELNKLKKDNASYVFFRTKVVVDPYKQSILLEGIRQLLMGGKVISEAQESYRLRFTNFGGRLLLSSIERGEES